MTNLWIQSDTNKRRTVYLVFVFIVFVIALGWFLSYLLDAPVILYIAVVVAFLQSFIGYYAGDRIILLRSHAREIVKKDNPNLWNIVENLSITAGLPMPKIYIIADPSPNAFATGRDPKHASVAVTSGLLERLNNTELEGVMAHELSHVGNYDIRLMTLVAILVSVIAILTNIFLRARFWGFGGRDRNSSGGGQIQLLFLVLGLLAAILAPIIATIVQLAISRKREYLADADGALLTRYPEGLASALEKISEYQEPVRTASTATAHMYIENPLQKDQKRRITSWQKLFATHPPAAERIKILRNMDRPS